MRLIMAGDITGAVSHLFKKANYELGEDVLGALKKAQLAEESPAGREVLEAVEVGIEMGGGLATVSARFALEVMEMVFPPSQEQFT